MPTIEIRVRYESSIASQARAEAPSAYWQPLPDGCLLGTHRVSDVDAFVRWVLGWGDAMTVIGPPDVLRHVHRLLSAMLARHRQPIAVGGRPERRPILREVK